MEAIAARIARDYPEGRTGHTVPVGDLRTGYTGLTGGRCILSLGGGWYCSDVRQCRGARARAGAAPWTRVRAAGRARRRRGALVRQLLVEGALLAIPGGALGLLFTGWTLGALSRFIPADFLVRGNRIPVDARVCLAAFTVAALTAVVFGLVPAVFARRLNLNVTLGQGSRTTGASPGQARARHLLLAAQVALTVVLVAAAGSSCEASSAYAHAARLRAARQRGASGVAERTAIRERRADPGIHRRLLERARATPGVETPRSGPPRRSAAVR